MILVRAPLLSLIIQVVSLPGISVVLVTSIVNFGKFGVIADGDRNVAVCLFGLLGLIPGLVFSTNVIVVLNGFRVD